MTDTPGDRARQRRKIERQRFDHLALGRARPKPTGHKTRRVAKPTALAPGVEDWVALREKWSHKAGTAETMERVELAAKQPGALARMLKSGAIDADQLAAAEEIATAHRAITAAVRVRTANYERVDGGARDAGEEAFARMRGEVAYRRWRDEVGPLAAPLLAMIVDDDGVVATARRYRVSTRRMGALLAASLSLWWTARRHAG